ncbi:MAG: hypothetical protein Q9165_006274 [Trypethelium subeluteriae]
MADEKDADFPLAEHGYLLNRGHMGSCRLNLQYYLWKSTIGFSLHPSIFIGPQTTIADVATGTGIWLLELAQLYPEAQMDGFDIDLSTAPDQHWLPHNVKINHWDIFNKPPDHLIGRYDVVHVRLLVLVITNDAGSVLRNLLSLLKPGGVLQWDDIDYPNMHVKYTNTIDSAPALEQIREMNWAGGKYDWLLNLPKLLQDAGFENTSLQQFGDPDHLVRPCCDLNLMTMEEFAYGLRKAGENREAKAFQSIISKAYEESIRGAALCVTRFVCLAYKPARSD